MMSDSEMALSEELDNLDTLLGQVNQEVINQMNNDDDQSEDSRTNPDPIDSNSANYQSEEHSVENTNQSTEEENSQSQPSTNEDDSNNYENHVSNANNDGPQVSADDILAQQMKQLQDDIAASEANQQQHARQEEEEEEEEEDDEVEPGEVRDKRSKRKLTKAQKKKLRKKEKRKGKNKEQVQNDINKSYSEQKIKQEKDDDVDEGVEIEYVAEDIKKDAIYAEYLKVFEKFRIGDDNRDEEKEEEEELDPAKKLLERKKPVEFETKDEEEQKDGEEKLSKRKMKQLRRMTIADLKTKVSHPELVEMHDVTAKDPILLLQLKSTRNTVPVPRHWCYKRKYLQGKRGFEKPPFKLPEFIRRTGIMEMRQAVLEKEEEKTMKTKMREKVRPKMGKIDIDYQKLHDAFFKWQTKPKMTIHGDLYYEGKEFETRLKEKKPGELSNELRIALGMPIGPNANKCPPPWLIAMQRYGPPPSYPNLKIPGLNAPIPEGCSFGYHAGGWGKPPVDEFGRPLYGDVFGTNQSAEDAIPEEEVDKSHWGEIESESEVEESSEEEEDEEEEEGQQEVEPSGLVTPAEGLATPAGLKSVPPGMETPAEDFVIRKTEERKRKIEAEMESSEPQNLYTIIPEKKVPMIGREMMASAHVYDISAAKKGGAGGIEVALDPNDLELDPEGMEKKLSEKVKEHQAGLAKEDLSDMVAEHVARQKRKKDHDDSSKSKKHNKFKF